MAAMDPLPSTRDIPSGEGQAWYEPTNPNLSSYMLVGGPPMEANQMHSNDPFPHQRGIVKGAIGDPAPPATPANAPRVRRPNGILGLGILPRIRSFLKF